MDERSCLYCSTTYQGGVWYAKLFPTGHENHYCSVRCLAKAEGFTSEAEQEMFERIVYAGGFQ
jgi:hypothetical protein